jgi:hypothetical protein
MPPELLMCIAVPLMVRLFFNRLNFAADGLLISDEGGCCEDCTDFRSSIDGLPVSSPCCAKAAGICRLLLEVENHPVETRPCLRSLLGTHGYLSIVPLEFISSRARPVHSSRYDGYIWPASLNLGLSARLGWCRRETYRVMRTPLPGQPDKS